MRQRKAWLGKFLGRATSVKADGEQGGLVPWEWNSSSPWEKAGASQEGPSQLQQTSPSLLSRQEWLRTEWSRLCRLHSNKRGTGINHWQSSKRKHRGSEHFPRNFYCKIKVARTPILHNLLQKLGNWPLALCLSLTRPGCRSYKEAVEWNRCRAGAGEMGKAHSRGSIREIPSSKQANSKWDAAIFRKPPKRNPAMPKWFNIHTPVIISYCINRPRKEETSLIN